MMLLRSINVSIDSFFYYISTLRCMFSKKSYQKKIIEVSELFDKTWYKKTYSDICWNKTNPISHYLSEGYLKGFDPSPVFSTVFYLNAYPEIKRRRINPLFHYIFIGRKRGYKTSLSKKALLQETGDTVKHQNTFNTSTKTASKTPPKQYIIFLINLIQDVNILKPLISFASHHVDTYIEIYLTKKFHRKDKSKIWHNEIYQVADQAGALVYFAKDNASLHDLLAHKSGLLIAGSESSIQAHIITHVLFGQAPSSFTRITLQHGLECPGFLNNKVHSLAYGNDIVFNADIIAGWCDEKHMLALSKSERSKYQVLGPTSLLERRHPPSRHKPDGIVCENLHSVRFNISDEIQSTFVQTFMQFSAKLYKDGQSLTLRPHPAGQYFIKHKIKLSKNVSISREPIYHINLSQYAYAISSPSSVIIDMMLANVPVAVWIDKAGSIDARHYQGLPFVSSVDEWYSFSQDAVCNKQSYIDKQYVFLDKLGFLYERDTIYQRYLNLLNHSLAKHAKEAQCSSQKSIPKILLVANSRLPTLQICLLKPIHYLMKRHSLQIEIVAEDAFIKNRKIKKEKAMIELNRLLTEFEPTHLIFCRYSGVLAAHLLKWVRQRNIKTFYHIDDDLLNVPITLGLKKYIHHNDPGRLKSVKYLLDNVDVTCCSTDSLRKTLLKYHIKSKVRAGKINCSSRILSNKMSNSVSTIGYMGFDHDNDFLCCLDAVEKYLQTYPQVKLELFGAISKPRILMQFNDRVTVIPPIREYDLFMSALAKRQWDIGICPLANTSFNHLKSNNKWIEYTACATAVIATKGMVYDEVCSHNCGVLVETNHEWYQALCKLTEDDVFRKQLILNAQYKLSTQYNIKKHARQLAEMFEFNQCMESSTIN